MLEKHNILDNVQSGFRKLHSTALLKVSIFGWLRIRVIAQPALGLPDLISAFEMSNLHQILVQQLNYMVGISGSFLEWVTSFLAYRTLLSSLGNFGFETAAFPCGILQGSGLSPLLWGSNNSVGRVFAP